MPLIQTLMDINMKHTHFAWVLLSIALLTACSSNEERLRQRAMELCQYIPDHNLLEQSRDYMTDDFYAVLDTMFHLPEHEAMDHEWLYYFVTGNGGTIADYEVVNVEKTDNDHAIATIHVRQKWEDGSFAEDCDIEEHRLYMERVNGQWLMSDFDEHKADCIRHIAINRREQAVRETISQYLVSEIGSHYRQGELCVPVLMMVAETENDDTSTQIWGDFWVFWYNQVGDTLKCVSGGDHAGLITLAEDADGLHVASFEQVEDGSRYLPTAQRIFGEHYDLFQDMHSNKDVREAVRREQLNNYVRLHELPVRYYQDYGWPAVEL